MDGYIKKQVNIGLRKLSDRADEIGKILTGELFGCKELKYITDDIRIIYRIEENQIEIVDIFATANLADEEVFQTLEAIKRLKLKAS